MAKLLTAREVWTEIRLAVRRGRSRHVAVAFLGSASPRLLALRSGDLLVVNLSESAVRNGSTSVRAARAFYRRGVHLCNSEQLHAKLFVFDDTVIVGSANASENSASILLEAAVKITDERVAARARKFIQSLAHQTVTPAYLRLCARWQKESARARKQLKQSRGARVKGKPRGSRVWILSSTPAEFTTRATDDRNAQRRIRAPREFRREPISWFGAPNLGPQDQVIVAHFERGHLEVSPPGRFLARGKSVEGKTVIYVELPHRPRVASVSKFRKLVGRGLGVRRKTIPTKRIPQGWVSEFLQLWPKGFSISRGSQ